MLKAFIRVHVVVPVVHHQISQVHIYAVWYTCKTHKTRTYHTQTQHSRVHMDCIFYTQQSEDTGYTKAEQLFWTHVDHLSSISLAKAGV